MFSFIFLSRRYIFSEFFWRNSGEFLEFIIGIIAAIAIPNLLAARRASNEGSAISSLRTHHGAQLTYQTTAGAGNFAGDARVSVAAFTVLGTANLIDPVLASGTKSGYDFTGQKVDAAAGAPAGFAGTAYPGVSPVTSSITATGTRDFAILTEGVIFASETLNSPISIDETGGVLTQLGGSPLNN